MAPHSSTPAWKIPWTEEPGRLQSMGSLRVRRNCAITFTFHFHALEKEMATHSSVLAWRITGMGGLPSLGSHRVRHDWSDLAAAEINYFIVNSSYLEGNGIIYRIKEAGIWPTRLEKGQQLLCSLHQVIILFDMHLLAYIRNFGKLNIWK